MSSSFVFSPNISLKIGTLFFFLVLILSIQNAFAATPIFIRTLKLGSYGEDVHELQKMLNSDAATRIQEIGPGSPGNETNYFGILTRNAVIRFQEKYRADILTPNGLISGTGFVGQSTLGVLSKLNQTLNTRTYSRNNPAIISAVLPSTKPNEPVHVATTNHANPNEKNLDTFLSIVEKYSRDRGISSDAIATIKSQIIHDVATSTDLQDQFLHLVQAKISQAPVPVKSFLADITRSLKTSLFPKRVIAGTGTPFGGALLFSFFCTCSANWLITLQPLPPTFATLLSYEIGSQLYLSYNIPYTNWLLGEYTAGAGQCLIYVGTGCASIPSTGLITPTVGSSPL